jgi:hypothetical protein
MPGELFVPRKHAGNGENELDTAELARAHLVNFLHVERWANSAMQETIFTLPGALTTDMSPGWVPQVNTTITNVVSLLTQVATSSSAVATTLTYYKNGSAVSPTISLSATTPLVTLFTPALNLKGNTDYLQVEATVVGTSAKNLSSHVRPY